MSRDTFSTIDLDRLANSIVKAAEPELPPGYRALVVVEGGAVPGRCRPFSLAGSEGTRPADVRVSLAHVLSHLGAKR